MTKIVEGALGETGRRERKKKARSEPAVRSSKERGDIQCCRLRGSGDIGTA